ncbi:protein kinase [Sorangium sp. So ce260]|uniref:serine/threonine-protein kinase n=1 Tax=Sorangium sp. So ce260 TaxID=3133291 RepID=UPI003F631774
MAGEAMRSGMAGLEMAPGNVLAGKYRVERVLGQGGMGLVVGAWHLHLDEPVAIKVLRDELAQNQAIIDRFLREARAAAKIKSRHVVRVTDADRLPSGAPYLVMEWLSGSDLASIVEREGPMDTPRAVRHVLEACEALGEAHALGIVHRDLKPSNLFAARQADGSTCTKILDFGISKLLGEELTGTGNALGTPSYMAPEQMVSARNVDARADIWALGVVLYKLVTGTVPFRASTPSELGMKVLFGEPEPPEQARPDLPPGLAQVILRCMRREPAQRFATAAQLAAALAPFAGQARTQQAAPGAQTRPQRDATLALAPAVPTPHAATASGTLSSLNEPIPRASATPPQDATPGPTTADGRAARKPGLAAIALIMVTLAAAGGGLALWARGASSGLEVSAEQSATSAADAPAPATPDPASAAKPRVTLAPSAPEPSAGAVASAPASIAPGGRAITPANPDALPESVPRPAPPADTLRAGAAPSGRPPATAKAPIPTSPARTPPPPRPAKTPTISYDERN